MSTYNIAVAKAKLSSLVNRALQGEEVIISRNNKPLLMLVPVEETPKQREPGTGKGQILFIADDFDAALDDFKKYR